MALKIAIGCSNYLFSEGLRELLRNELDIKIVGTSNFIPSALSSLKEIADIKPDLIITDFHEEFNSFLVDPEDFIDRGKTKILLIGDRTVNMFAGKYLKSLIALGVVGILPPSADSGLLRKALKAITAGDLWLDRAALLQLLTSQKRSDSTIHLAGREKEIIFHICQGYRNKEIAQKLRISEQTVKSHCSRIYRKLGVTDRLQLALMSHRFQPELDAKNRDG